MQKWLLQLLHFCCLTIQTLALLYIYSELFKKTGSLSLERFNFVHAIEQEVSEQNENINIAVSEVMI